MFFQLLCRINQHQHHKRNTWKIMIYKCNTWYKAPWEILYQITYAEGHRHFILFTKCKVSHIYKSRYSYPPDQRISKCTNRLSCRISNPLPIVQYRSYHRRPLIPCRSIRMGVCQSRMIGEHIDLILPCLMNQSFIPALKRNIGKNINYDRNYNKNDQTEFNRFYGIQPILFCDILILYSIDGFGRIELCISIFLIPAV